VSAADQRRELLARLLPIAEGAEHATGHDDGVLLLDAAHPHAEMFGFDDDTDALRIDGFHQRGRHLGGQALLHLEAPGENLEQPRQLAEPQDLLAGNVGDVRLAEKRQHVVLAEGEEIEVLEHDHLGVLFGEERPVDHLARVLLMPLGEEAERTRHAHRRAGEALAPRLGIEGAEERADVALDLLLSHRPSV